MTLIPNWKEVLKKAWSVKLAALSALFTGMKDAMAYVPADLVGASPELLTAIGDVLGGIAGVFAAGVVVARILDQGLVVKDE